MARLPLLERRIHISGSISKDASVASRAAVETARQVLERLVPELVRQGANFVVPVDAEPVRDDGQPICFDWLVWEAISRSLHLRPPSAAAPLAVAVQHHKSEEQVPPGRAALWDAMRGSPLVRIENAAYWNMASKRLETQARVGDVLLALGGSEGVHLLANLYHDAGKPVIPLDLPVCGEHEGARKVFAFGLASSRTERLFRTADGLGAHAWLNRVRWNGRKSVEGHAADILALLEALAPPRAFGVRLLNPGHEDHAAVEDHFENVVRPVVEGELGYELAVVDGQQAYERARIDEEIFAKLHRSAVVLADITGGRPNCFIELGYALGRQLPTMVMCREGSPSPFDITTFSGLRWREGGSPKERRAAFREHWEAIRSRPPMVPVEPLIA